MDGIGGLFDSNPNSKKVPHFCRVPHKKMCLKLISTTPLNAPLPMAHQLIMGATAASQYQTWRIPATRVAHNGQTQWPDDDHHRLTRPIDEPMRNWDTKLQHYFHLHQPDRWYRTLPPSEMLPRNEALGGYIFVCNNDTMQEDLRRQLFGLPQKYKDSVRAITPGLPLFLYNYTAHQLHGVYQAMSFGGSNIDPTAWEDKKCRGESRFPAQVRIRTKKKCKPLDEDAFRPILYHYDGPKFRLQLSVPEALALLDLFEEEDP